MPSIQVQGLGGAAFGASRQLQGSYLAVSHTMRKTGLISRLRLLLPIADKGCAHRSNAWVPTWAFLTGATLAAQYRARWYVAEVLFM